MPADFRCLDGLTSHTKTMTNKKVIGRWRGMQESEPAKQSVLFSTRSDSLLCSFHFCLIFPFRPGAMTDQPHNKKATSSCNPTSRVGTLDHFCIQWHRFLRLRFPKTIRLGHSSQVRDSISLIFWSASSSAFRLSSSFSLCRQNFAFLPDRILSHNVERTKIPVLENTGRIDGRCQVCFV
jgi:hypothetical protein